MGNAHPLRRGMSTQTRVITAGFLGCLRRNGSVVIVRILQVHGLRGFLVTVRETVIVFTVWGINRGGSAAN